MYSLTGRNENRRVGRLLDVFMILAPKTQEGSALVDMQPKPNNASRVGTVQINFSI